MLGKIVFITGSAISFFAVSTVLLLSQTPTPPKHIETQQQEKPEIRVINLASTIGNGFISAKGRETVQIDDLTVTIEEIIIFRTSCTIRATIRNTGSEEIVFFQTLGTIVIGDKQFDYSQEGDLSGTIQPGVEKAGTLSYRLTGNKSLVLNEVRGLRLNLVKGMGKPHEAIDIGLVF
jgi:hypothetical protein